MLLEAYSVVGVREQTSSTTTVHESMGVVQLKFRMGKIPGPAALRVPHKP